MPHNATDLRHRLESSGGIRVLLRVARRSKGNLEIIPDVSQVLCARNVERIYRRVNAVIKLVGFSQTLAIRRTVCAVLSLSMLEQRK